MVALKLGFRCVYQLATDTRMCRGTLGWRRLHQMATCCGSNTQAWARYEDVALQAPKRVLARYMMINVVIALH